MKKLLKIIAFLTLNISCFILIFNFRIFAQTASTNVDTTVKLSICGDLIIEGSEDCEGEDLDGQTCESLGYVYGTLSCDVACSFDTTDCVSLTPTPTPIPTSMPTLEPTSASAPTSTPEPSSTIDSSTDSASVNDEESAGTAEQETLYLSLKKKVDQFIEEIITKLPSALKFFDFNDSGRIEADEFVSAIELWVNHWRQVMALKEDNFLSQDFNQTLTKDDLLNCDLNNDDTCTLQDFSILLSFIDKK